MAIRNDLIQSRSAYIGSSSSVSPSVGNLVVDGNVGIGTTSPANKLDVIGNVLVQGTQGFNATGETASIYVGDIASEIRAVFDGGLDFYQNSVHRMRIQGGTGNVGIGTTAPARILELSQAEPYLRFNPTAVSGAYLLGAADGKFYFTPESSYVATMTLSSGNVGIGTTSPGYKLDVNGAGRFIFRNNSNEITDLLLSTESANSKSKLSFLWYGNETAAVKFLRGGNSTGSSMEFWTQQEFGSTTQRMTITSAGNVGIGTTSPSDKLQVIGNGRFGVTSGEDWGIGIDHGSGSNDYGRIRFYQNGSNYSTIHSFSQAWQSGTVFNSSSGALNFDAVNGATFGLWYNPDIVFVKGGISYFKNNVGIGTTSPNRTLSVNGIVGVSSGTANVPQLLLSSDANGNYISSTYMGTSSYVPMVFETGGSERMRIAANGNVGIGTSSPNDFGGSFRVLDVKGNTGGYILSTNSDNSTIAQMGVGSNISYYGTRTNADVVITTNNTEKMRITSSGNVGIGTTSPGDKLDVSGNIGIGNAGNKLYNGSSNDSAGLFFNSNVTNISGYSGINFRSSTTNVSSQTIRMFIQNDGNVGIGTTSPSSKLEIRGAQSASKSSLLLLSKFDYGTTTFFQNYSNTFYTNGKSLEIEVETLPMLQLATNNAATEGKVIFPNGNVGIGSSNPANYSGYTTLEVAASSGGVFRLKNNAESGVFEMATTSANTYIKNVTSTPMWFGTANTERMRITSSGNVGIGTTSPGSLLTVEQDYTTTAEFGAFGQFSINGKTNANKKLAIGFNTATDVGFIQAMENGVSYKNLLLNARGGNVGIGTTNPYSPLQVGSYTGSGGFSYGTAATFVSSFNSVRATLFVGSTDTTSTQDKGGSIDFGGGSEAGSTPYTYARIKGYKEVAGGGYSGYLSFSTTPAGSDANTERMRINSFGNVGIGSSNPYNGSRLEVRGSGVWDGGTITLTNSGTGGRSWSLFSTNNSFGQGAGKFLIYNSTDGTNALIIDSSNNVGIGTSSPTYKLDVQGTNVGSPLVSFVETSTDSDRYSQLEFQAGNRFGYIWLGNENSGSWAGPGGLNIYTSNGNIDLWTSGSQKVRIDTSGNVGIGTTSPSQKLHVVGSRILVEETNAGIMFRTGGTNRYSVASTGGAFQIYDEVNSTNRLYITSGGNVGIGTTTPSGNLQVLGSSPIVPAIFNLTHFAGVGSPLDFTLSADAFGNGGISLSLSTNLTFSIAGSERMRITSSGSVGVGTSAPAASAIMHLSSTTQGFLPPQMKNSEMNAIASPATGLVVYDITNNKLTVYNGSGWVPLH